MTATGQIFLAWIWKINHGSETIFFQRLAEKKKKKLASKFLAQRFLIQEEISCEERQIVSKCLEGKLWSRQMC